MNPVAFNPPSSNTQLNKIKETIGFKSWLEQNTQIDESFKFCVLKEQALKCYICEQNNIPYFIDKIPENFISIFDVPQTGIDVMWNELMKDDIKRKIECGTWEDFRKYAKKHKKAFVKVYDKNGVGWTSKVIDLSNVLEQLSQIKEDAWECGDVRLLEMLNEFIAGDIDKLISAIGYNRQYSDKYLFTTAHNVEHEHRFVLSGNKIISYSPQSLDYEELRKPIDESLVNSMVAFVEGLAEKYWDKVPYKIWNIDVALFDGVIDIVECHFHCDNLGFYLDNVKKFKELFEAI